MMISLTEIFFYFIGVCCCCNFAKWMEVHKYDSVLFFFFFLILSNRNAVENLKRNYNIMFESPQLLKWTPNAQRLVFKWNKFFISILNVSIVCRFFFSFFLSLSIYVNTRTHRIVWLDLIGSQQVVTVNSWKNKPSLSYTQKTQW